MITWFVAMEMWHALATRISQNGNKKVAVYDNRVFKDTLFYPMHKEKEIKFRFNSSEVWQRKFPYIKKARNKKFHKDS